MQVRNSIDIDCRKPNLKLSNSYQLKSRGAQINFGNEAASPSKKEGENHYVKTATNALGVAAWFGVVGYSIFKLKMLNGGAPETQLTRMKKIKKSTQSMLETLSTRNAKSVEEELKNAPHKSLIIAAKKAGDFFQGMKMKFGNELFNNVTYALGTLFVMPAVVLWSPFGKKKSSKEDKTFAVLRQPLSVAATLTMQASFDKLLDKYVPEVLKQNILENKLLLKDGKIIFRDPNNNRFMHENFDAIKYNPDAAKEGFKELAKTVEQKDGGLKGILSEQEVNDLFNLKSYEDDSGAVLQGKLKEILNTKYGDTGLKLGSLDDVYTKSLSFTKFKIDNPKIGAEIENLLKRFKKVTTVLDNYTMAKQKSIVWVNILAAAAIGCTFLNVIYGKSMKTLSPTIKKLYGDDNKKAQPEKEVK